MWCAVCRLQGRLRVGRRMDGVSPPPPRGGLYVTENSTLAPGGLQEAVRVQGGLKTGALRRPGLGFGLQLKRTPESKSASCALISSLHKISQFWASPSAALAHSYYSQTAHTELISPQLNSQWQRWPSRRPCPGGPLRHWGMPPRHRPWRL